MFLNFTTIEDSQEQLEEEIPFWEITKNRDDSVDPRNGMKIPWYRNNGRKYSFWEHFFYCQCGHIYYNHVLCEGKCDAEYFGPCFCTEFVSVDAYLEITFTLADLFEVENPNHSESDSPQWWAEFGVWYENKYENERRNNVSII